MYPNKVTYLEVNNASSGKKLFQFLDSFFNKGVPKSALMKWIRTGQVRIDGKRARPFDRVYEGQKIRIPPFSIEEKVLHEKNDKNPFVLKKIYEDKNLLVLYKPPNLPTQPGKNIEDSLYHRLKKEYPDNTPYLVHRLDRETSGIILTAKSYNYLKYLHSIFLSRKVKKVYLAWVRGNTKWDSWTEIKHFFEEHRDGKTKKVGAISFVKTLKNTEDRSLVAVLIKTGRKHQIRIQMSLLGHPIIGERKYAKMKGSKGLMLHSYLIAWDEYVFSSMPPWRKGYKVNPNLLKGIFPLPSI